MLETAPIEPKVMHPTAASASSLWMETGPLEFQRLVVRPRQAIFPVFDILSIHWARKLTAFERGRGTDRVVMSRAESLSNSELANESAKSRSRELQGSVDPRFFQQGLTQPAAIPEVVPAQGPKSEILARSRCLPLLRQRQIFVTASSPWNRFGELLPGRLASRRTSGIGT
jgi:hypothetical protein